MNWRMRLARWLLKGVSLSELLDDSRKNVYVIQDNKGEPIVFADPQTVDFEMLGKDFPFDIIPARSRPGCPLSDSFMVIRLDEPKEAV